MHVLIHYPDLFDNYIAIDPSLDWDNRQLLSEAKEILPFVDYSNKSLFISLNGQLHMQKPEMTIANVMKDSTDFTSFSRANLAFSDLIKEHADNGLAYEWKFYPRDLHGTIPFPSMMDGLISVFEWFQMEDVHKFNNPESTINELRSLMQYRANKLEEHFGNVVPPYPDFLLNVLGYMSMDIGQMAKAKMFFEFVIEFYPDSANAYDSMADYYERNGDFVSALANIQKAYNIKQEDYYKERIEMLKKK
jgi:tetratricopeptide (TPR) repeat protein